MSDPFSQNSKSQLVREARIGLSLVAILFFVFVYVAYYRITGQGRKIPEHVRMAPIAKPVWPNEESGPTRKKFETDQNHQARSNGAVSNGFDSRAPFDSSTNKPTQTTQHTNSGFSQNPALETGKPKLRQRNEFQPRNQGFQPANQVKRTPQTSKTKSSTSQVATSADPRRPSKSDLRSGPFPRAVRSQLGNNASSSPRHLDRKWVAKIKQEYDFPTNVADDPFVAMIVEEIEQRESGVLGTQPREFAAQAKSSEFQSNRVVKASAETNDFGPGEFAAKAGGFDPGSQPTLPKKRPPQSGQTSKPAGNADKTPNSIFENNLRKLPSTPKSKSTGDQGNDFVSSGNDFVSSPSAVAASAKSIQVQTTNVPSRQTSGDPSHSASPSVQGNTTKPTPSNSKSQFSLEPLKNRTKNSEFDQSSNQPAISPPRQPPKSWYKVGNDDDTSMDATVRPGPDQDSDQESHQFVGLKRDDVDETKKPLKKEIGQSNGFDPSSTGLDSKARPTPETAVTSEDYTTEPGDSFWTIAQKVYGDGRYFRALYLYNRDKIKDFNSIESGMRLDTPDRETLVRMFPEDCPVDLAGHEKEAIYPLYRTRRNDTLFDIARDRLGQASRYLEILELNYSRLGSSVNHLTPLPAGIDLFLPE